MYFYFNQLLAYMERWTYSGLYYFTCGQHLFIHQIQKPAYRLWNLLYPPADVVERDTFALENNNKFIVTRHKKYCPVLEDYRHYDVVCGEGSVLNSVQTSPKISNVRFLDMELTFKDIDEMECSLSLHSPTRNYYMVGNTICSDFIHYFMQKYHPDVLEKYALTEPFEYTLTLVDHNVKVTVLTEKDSIVLKEYDYDVTLDKDDEDKLGNGNSVGEERADIKND
jgi:hypothetical protein